MTRRIAACMVAVVVAVAGFAGFGVSAGAQAKDAQLTIREVDAQDAKNVKVTFIYDGDRNNLPSLTVRENGVQIDTSIPALSPDTARLGVVLAIDTSGSMNNNAAIERAKEAALAYVDEKSPSEQVAIVTFGSDVVTIKRFTANAAELTAAIDAVGLSKGGGTKLYDGLSQAAGLFEKNTSLQPNILLLSDGDDTRSDTTPKAALGRVQRSNAVVFAVGIVSGKFKAAKLADIVERTGGRFVTTEKATELQSLFSDIHDTLARQYVVTFASKVRSGTGAADLRFAIGSAQDVKNYTPGALASGSAALEPVAIAKPGGPDFLRTSGGFAIGVLLVLVAGAMLVYSLVSIFSSDTSALQSALQPYAEGYVAGGDDDDDDGKDKGLAQTQFLQRAVAITGDFAERQGFLPRIEGMLERANLPLRAAEALFFYLAAVVVGTMLALVISQSAFGALIALGVFALLPPAFLSTLANRRRKQFEAMLPDTLQLLSSTLRAGYSLMQGVEAVSVEVSEPMGRELRRVVTEARLGRPLEVALEGVSDRMASGDFAWAVMAIRIQREVGGNLSELLLTVADTMTQRERLRRDVAALTAEGKISAIVLGVLPLGLMLMMYAINPEYIGVLFDRTVGQFLLGGAVIMMLGGFYWMKKIIDIEI